MTAAKSRLIALCAAVASLCAITRVATAAAQTCAGDCNGDGSVAIDEIILGARIALGDAPVADCRAMDADGNGAVTVGELVAAVSRGLQGCDDPAPPRRTPTPVSTDTPPPTSTPTGSVPTSDAVALAASVRVATEPIFRFLDFQSRIAPATGVVERSSMSGCRQVDCVAAGRVTGSEEDCCLGTEFTQVFHDCTFDDDLGRVVSLSGAFVLDSDGADVCAGVIPAGAGFAVSMSGFTDEVSSPDGSFSRTFQELTETFAAAPGGCTASQPDPFGFGHRGDGRRFVDGQLQQFRSDGAGNVVVDTESDVRGLAIEVRSTQQSDGCSVAAVLTGSVTSDDSRVGSSFTTAFSGFPIVQQPQAGALSLELDGTVDSDCLGPVTLSTAAPLRLAPGDACFTDGRLDTQFGDETALVTYTQNAGLDIDLSAAGSVDQHFATCTDVPASDKCR